MGDCPVSTGIANFTVPMKSGVVKVSARDKVGLENRVEQTYQA